MASVRDFGAVGDGKTDDTAALSHAVQHGDGELFFPRGDYLITQPLALPLDLHGRIGISGAVGTAKLIMAGPGPAIHLVGTHTKSALPENFVEGIWRKERMPMVQGLEIEGRHPEADGIRIEGAMQPTIRGVLIRLCRHGIHLLSRDRNVDISDCHIYNNSGVGIFFDHLNLHQTNIHGNHISYCKQGGINIIASEIRNIQICSNDIEYNFDLKAETSADVLFDCREGTVREGTIVGNTIQALQSPNGANVRFLGAGKDNVNAVGMLTIAGNLLGSQLTLVHLQACRGVVVSGNCMYNGFHNAILAEDAEHLVISGNSIDHNSDYKGNSTDAVILRRCRHVSLSGVVLQHTRAPLIPTEASVEIRDCEDVNVTGCQVVNARSCGIVIGGSSLIRVADCTLRGRVGANDYKSAIRVEPGCSRVMVVNNFLGKGSEGDLQLPAEAGWSSGNMGV